MFFFKLYFTKYLLTSLIEPFNFDYHLNVLLLSNSSNANNTTNNNTDESQSDSSESARKIEKRKKRRGQNASAAAVVDSPSESKFLSIDYVSRQSPQQQQSAGSSTSTMMSTRNQAQKSMGRRPSIFDMVDPENDMESENSETAILLRNLPSFANSSKLFSLFFCVKYKTFFFLLIRAQILI